MTETKQPEVAESTTINPMFTTKQYEFRRDADDMRALAQRIERHSSGLAKALRETAAIAERIGEAA